MIEGLPSEEACDAYAGSPSQAQIEELRRWARADEPNLRVCAAYGASVCAERVPEAARLLGELLEDPSPVVRFAAAMEGSLNYLVELVEPARLAAPLDSPVEFRDSIAEQYELLPFFGGASLAGRYAVAVGNLAEHAFPLARHLLALLENDPVPQEAIEIGQGLLMLTFSGADHCFHPNFVEHLEALAACKEFFVWSADAHHALGEFGLTEHGGLEAIIATLRASDDPLATFKGLMGLDE